MSSPVTLNGEQGASTICSLEPGFGIVATGSIFLVADVREAWAHHTNLDLPLGDWVDEPWEPHP